MKSAWGGEQPKSRIFRCEFLCWRSIFIGISFLEWHTIWTLYRRCTVVLYGQESRKKKNKSCSTRLKSKSRSDVWRDTFNAFARSFFILRKFFCFFFFDSLRHILRIEFEIDFTSKDHDSLWYIVCVRVPARLSEKSFLFLPYANWSIRISVFFYCFDVIQSIDSESVAYLKFLQFHKQELVQ